MKIDREELTSLLVEKSGLDEQEVGSRLDTLLEHIRRAAGEGKSFEIEGFGTFRMEEEELQFEPADTLSTEINQKYAGMKPIELIGAFKEQGTPGEEGDSENVVAAEGPDEQRSSGRFELDTEAVEEGEEKPRETAPSGSGESSEEDAADGAGEEPDSRRSRIKARAAKARKEAAKRSGDETEEPEKPIKTEKQKKQKDEEKDKGKEQKAPAEKGAGKQKKDPSPSVRKHVKTSREKNAAGSSVGRFAAAVVVIIAVAAAGWMAWNAGLFTASDSGPGTPVREDSRPTLRQNEDPAGGQESAADDQQAGVQTTDEQQTGDETEQSGGGAVSTDSEQAASAAYGLTGSINEDLDTYYTIVIHSLQEQPAAETRAGELREDGYRVTVRQATVNGTAYWRVGIGQFETVSAARQSAAGLPEPYRSDNFIRNIQ